jgi:uncharacterized membrane protein
MSQNDDWKMGVVMLSLIFGLFTGLFGILIPVLWIITIICFILMVVAYRSKKPEGCIG